MRRFCLNFLIFLTNGADYTAANEYWVQIEKLPLPVNAASFSDEFRLLFHRVHTLLGPHPPFQSCHAQFIEFKTYKKKRVEDHPFPKLLFDELLQLQGVGSWHALEMLGFACRLFHLANGARVVHVSGHQIAYSQLVCDLNPRLCSVARHLLVVVLNADSGDLVYSSAQAMDRLDKSRCANSEPRDGVPVFWYELDGSRFGATHLSPDARELDLASVSDFPNDNDVSFASPISSRYCYDTSTIQMELANYCCIGLSVEVGDFLDGIPPSEPFVTRKIFSNMYRCSPVRLCNAVRNTGMLPLAHVCAGYTRLERQRQQLREKLEAIVAEHCSQPNQQNALGRAFISLGRDGVVASLALMKSSALVKLLNL
jgi:hypothetical protein